MSLSSDSVDALLNPKDLLPLLELFVVAPDAAELSSVLDCCFLKLLLVEVSTVDTTSVLVDCSLDGITSFVCSLGEGSAVFTGLSEMFE